MIGSYYFNVCGNWELWLWVLGVFGVKSRFVACVTWSCYFFMARAIRLIDKEVRGVMRGGNDDSKWRWKRWMEVLTAPRVAPSASAILWSHIGFTAVAWRTHLNHRSTTPYTPHTFYSTVANPIIHSLWQSSRGTLPCHAGLLSRPLYSLTTETFNILSTTRLSRNEFSVLVACSTPTFIGEET